MKSLKGKVLAITRNNREAAEFSRLVSAEGGTAIALPTIEIVPEGPKVAKNFVDELLAKRHEFCAFMSAQAVEILSMTLGSEKLGRALNSTSVIAVGPKTRGKLEELGLKVDFVPAEFSSKGMVKMLSRMKPTGKKIIIPRSATANDYAAVALRSLGMEVDEVLLYTVKTSVVTKEWKQFAGLLEEGKIDAIIFTSTSSVGSFFEILRNLLEKRVDINRAAQVISIGPFTTQELKKRKIESFEAQVHTVIGTFAVAKDVLSK